MEFYTIEIIDYRYDVIISRKSKTLRDTDRSDGMRVNRVWPLTAKEVVAGERENSELLHAVERPLLHRGELVVLEKQVLHIGDPSDCNGDRRQHVTTRRVRQCMHE